MRIRGKGGRLMIPVLVLGLLGACGGGGGGGGGEPQQPGGVESWSPFLVRDSRGFPETVTWTYLVNGGESVAVEREGVEVEIDLSSPMTVRYDPSTGERTTVLPFGFSGAWPDVPGTVNGTGTATVVEEIAVDGGITRIARQSADADLSGAYLLFGVSADAESALEYDTPLDWFPDRADLGDLPVGTVHAPAAEVTGTVSGSARASVTGLPEQSYPFAWPFSAPQRWEIVDRLPTFVVGGRTFADVVVVDLSTVLPDLTNPSEPPAAPVSVRMWFAKGIGLIRATGALTLWESPLDIEIVSTSLVP